MRELPVGEEVMVMVTIGTRQRKDYNRCFSVGDIVTVNREGMLPQIINAGGDTCSYLKRHELLAVGDRVKCGPDWQGFDKSFKGTIVKLRPNEGEVRWDNYADIAHLTMSPTCQKLAHADEVEVREGKPTSIDEAIERDVEPKCFSEPDKCGTCDATCCCYSLKYKNCTCDNNRCPFRKECDAEHPWKAKGKVVTVKINKLDSITEEDTMENRSATKRNLRETLIPELKDNVENAKQELATAEAKLARLEKYPTKEAEILAAATDFFGSKKKAEAALVLQENGLEVK